MEPSKTSVFSKIKLDEEDKVSEYRNYRAESVLAMRRKQREESNLSRRMGIVKQNEITVTPENVRKTVELSESNLYDVTDKEIREKVEELSMAIRDMLNDLSTYTTVILLGHKIREYREYYVRNGCSITGNVMLNYNLHDLLIKVAMKLYYDKSVDIAEPNKISILHEIMWILTNFTAGETNHVESIACEEVFVLLGNIMRTTSNINLYEQVVWTIGNIAGDLSRYKQYITQMGFIQLILNRLIDFLGNGRNGIGYEGNKMANNDVNRTNMIKTVLWVLSNFCRRPAVGYDNILPIFEEAKLWLTNDNHDITKEAMWTICYAVESHNRIVELIINSSLLTPILGLISRYNVGRRPALRCIGEICIGKASDMLAVVQAGGVRILSSIICSEIGKTKDQADAAWILSNIAIGSYECLESIVIESNIIKAAIKSIDTNADWRLTAEFTWILTNIINSPSSTFEIARKMVDMGIIEVLLKIIEKNKMKPITIVINALKKLVIYGEEDIGQRTRYNVYKDMIVKKGGIEILNKLLDSSDEYNDLSMASLSLLKELDKSYHKDINMEYGMIIKDDFDAKMVSLQENLLHIPSMGYKI